MAKRKTLSDIGKQSRIKLRRKNEDVKPYFDIEKNIDEEDILTVTSLNKNGHYLRSNDFKAVKELEVFTNAAVHVNTSKQLISSSTVESTHNQSEISRRETCNGDHLQKEDNQGQTERTFLRDDSGYKSEEFSETSSDSDDNEAVECSVFSPDQISKQCIRNSYPNNNKVENTDDTEMKGDFHKPKSESPNGFVNIDESDEIVTTECIDIILDKKPKPVDSRWARKSLESGIEKYLIKTGTVKRRRNSLPAFFRRDKYIEPNDKGCIYIQQDTFGAWLWTYINQQDHYIQHFLVDVKSDGPAAKMKIKSYDELVLLNGRFVPDLSHSEVLDLFKSVKVDGRTRFKAVLRRLVEEGSKKVRDWIETSALLYPDSEKDKDKYPEVEAEKFRPIRSNIYQTEKVCNFKTTNREQHYLDIKNNSVVASVKTGTRSDKSKLIREKIRVYFSPETRPQFTAALFCEINSKYIIIDQNFQVRLDEKPMYFDIEEVSDTVSFKIKGRYLSCNGRNLKIESSRSEYWFQEFHADDEVDCSLQNTCSMQSTYSLQNNCSLQSTCSLQLNGISCASTKCMKSLRRSESDSKRSQESMDCDTEVPTLNKSLKLDTSQNQSERKISSEIMKTPTTPFSHMQID